MSCYVIAEAGVNHNGDEALAHQLVDAAADTGADAVKFQTFTPEQLVTQNAARANYQKRNQPGELTQLEMLRQLSLNQGAHRALLAHCADRNIDFLSSPFDSASAAFLVDELQLPTIKLGSGELTNGPLLWQLGRTDRKLILSTGMATLDEIREALGLLCHALEGHEKPETSNFGDCFKPGLLSQKVSLLHCTTEYPCPIEAVNLRAMDTLAETFNLPVGYSDHTQGITVSLAAAARGATLIEKHLTLDRNLPGPDHKASIEPEELRELVEGVRTITQALGSNEKKPHAMEQGNAAVARKSLCALKPIQAGEPFSTDNLGVKRPGTGISPMRYWELLDNAAKHNYDADETLQDF